MIQTSKDWTFFNKCNFYNDKGELNLEIWNNYNVHILTGFSILDIKKCLFNLATFISNNLQPNRLACFNIQKINEANIYELDSSGKVI